MRYPAQVQTAIELFSEIVRAGVPADKYMAGFFRARRYIGSTDKGVVADLVYTLMRRLAEVDYLIELNKADVGARTRMIVSMLLSGATKKDLGNLFCGEKYYPAELNKEEERLLKSLAFSDLMKAPHHVRFNYPKWMTYLFKEAFTPETIDDELKAMNGRAGSDIRVNALKQNRDELLEELLDLGFDMTPTPYSDMGLRMPTRKSLFGTKAFLNGNFEMQDEGSQLIAAFCEAKPGQKVVDFCAGAGGKTLALAAEMQNKGGLKAFDIHERRLKEMPKRLKRAGVHNVEAKVLTSENDKWVKRHKSTQDVVLVDAPCSGMGTWRRSPDARWRFDQEDLENLVLTQASILASAARLVKPGGRVVYATCSVLPNENQEQVMRFLSENSDFKLLDARDIAATCIPLPESVFDNGMVCLTPHRTATDGFFIAVMERASDTKDGEKIKPEQNESSEPAVENLENVDTVVAEATAEEAVVPKTATSKTTTE